MLATLLPRFASANLVGPYTPDANTLFLLHLDEAAGSSVTTNVGILGGNYYSVNFSSSGVNPPVVNTMLGAPGYSNGSINFTNCENNTTAGYELGYDYNRDGAFEADNGSGSPSPDGMVMTNLNIGNGGQTPFTLEALIQPTSTTGNQEIICTDSSGPPNGSNTNRAFQFRISSGTLMFQFIANSAAMSATIPTTGQNAFVAGAWYHVAFTYNGSVGTLYWTKLDPSIGAANVIGSQALTLGTADGAVTGPLIVGNRGRPTGTETFFGGIDEVRISKVARAANQMQFFSPLVTITQNPVSQNVDYNQPVTFSVGASSLSALGYQWYFNSNGIPGATNSSYVITNVAAANAGYYQAVVTNVTGSSATSTPALLVVGAANFLNHRYSFNGNANDSIGNANGTLLGDAVVTNGSLVLDGTAGTYMQLPSNLFTGANATALTVEFWATFGVNQNNSYVFSFGNTNIILGTVNGSQYVIYTPHYSGGQALYITPSDSGFAQSATAPNNLDNLTVHVACVIDSPDQTLAIYTNGVLESINTNLTISLANVNDVFSYIGGSLFPADPDLNGSIDELRIFNGALSPISIKQSDVQGPNLLLANGPATFAIQPVNTSVPLGQTATFSAAAVGYLPITYQWFKNGTLVPGATNATYSFVPTLTDNNASIKVNATNTIGVTTYVANSSTVTLTVFIPPTLSWLGTADGGADNNWNTTSLDWTNDVSGGGIIPFTQTNGVLFDDRSGGGSVDLEQAIIPYNITVNAASSYTLSSSGQMGSLFGQGALTKMNSGTLTIDLTNNMTGPTTISGGKLQIGNFDSFGTLSTGPVTNNGTLSFTRSDTLLSVPSAIHGTGTVSFDGTGATTISGTSDYTGPTLLNSGVVFLTSSTGLGSTSSGTIVANGAQLYITGNVNIGPEALSLNGAGDGNGALRKGGAGATTYFGAINLASESTIGVDSGATLTLSNSISGTSDLIMNGSGTLVLTMPGSFTGGSTLSGPVVNLNANGALGPGPITVNNTGRFVIGDGLNFTNSLTASMVSPGTATGLLMVNDNTNGTVTTISGPLEFDATPANGNDFQGPITSGYLNVTSSITNTATGAVGSRNGFVRFSGGGNYTIFTLNQGTASIGANNGLSTSAALSMSVSAGSTFDLNGFSQTLSGLSDGVTPANVELVTNSVASQATLDLNLSSSYTYSGVIGGNVALVVSGTGSLDLAGTNTYTGNTTVTGGTLEIAQPALSAASTVTVASGGLLQLDFATTNTVAGFELNGASQPAGVYNSITSPTYLSGSGSLLVVPVVTNPTNIVFKVSGDNLNLSWPASYIGWRLLVQTNNLAKGISTNPNDWVTVPGSAATNQVNITIDPTKPAEFYRMVYP